MQDEDELILLHDNSEISEEDFFRKRDAIDPKSKFFKGFENDALKAILLWHLNAGHARFQGLHLNNDTYEGSTIEELLLRDIKKEQLSSEEQRDLISKYRDEHRYLGAPLIGCASCGVHSLQRGKVLYHKVDLASNEWLQVTSDPNIFDELIIDRRLATDL